MIDPYTKRGWIPNLLDGQYTEYSVTHNIDILYSNDSAIVAESVYEAIEILESMFGTPGLTVATKPFNGDRIWLYKEPFIGHSNSISEFVSLVKQFSPVSGGGLSLYSYSGSSWYNVDLLYRDYYDNDLSGRRIALLKEGIYNNDGYWTYNPTIANKLLVDALKQQKARERRRNNKDKSLRRYGALYKSHIVRAANEMFLTIKLEIVKTLGLQHFSIDIKPDPVYDKMSKFRSSCGLLDVLYMYNHLFGPNSYRKHPAFQEFKSVWAKKTKSAIRKSDITDGLISLMANEVSIKPPIGKKFVLRSLKSLRK